MAQRSKSISNRRQVKSSTTTRSASQNARSKARRNTEVLGGTQILVSPPPPSPYLKAETPTRIDKCHKCLGMSKSRRLTDSNHTEDKLSGRPPFNLDTHIDGYSDDEMEYSSRHDDSGDENRSDRNSIKNQHHIPKENNKKGQLKCETNAVTRLKMRKKSNNNKPPPVPVTLTLKKCNKTVAEPSDFGKVWINSLRS